MKGWFVTGIGTGVGKTVVSAILCETTRADYWKPVQAGNLDDTDSMCVRRLTTGIRIHPEGFRLSAAMSPHEAARKDGMVVEFEKMSLPKTEQPVVVEGVGGLLSPINDRHTNLDFIRWLRLPVILVSRNYLGSINHTLLTADVLSRHRIDVAGIVFCGSPAAYAEEYVLRHTELRKIACIEETDSVDHAFVRSQTSRVSL